MEITLFDLQDASDWNIRDHVCEGAEQCDEGEQLSVRTRPIHWPLYKKRPMYWSKYAPKHKPLP